MVAAEKVALLALAYRELSAPCSGFPGDEGLLVKMAADSLGDLDAQVIDAMASLDQLSALAVAFAEFDSLRYEALLHAWPPGDDPPPEVGFDRAHFTPARWDEVESEMRRFRALGITASRDVVEQVAQEAYALAGGSDR